MKASTDTTTAFEEQEVPILRKAMERAESGIGVGATSSSSSTSSSSCGCVHTWTVLPHRLDLEFCRTTAPNAANPKKHAARLRNPVHAWHLRSQLTDFTVAAEACPVLFGEEQERAMAVRSEGVMEMWHPLIHSPRNTLLVEKEEAVKRAISAGTITAVPTNANTNTNNSTSTTTTTTTTTKPNHTGTIIKPITATSTADMKSAIKVTSTVPPLTASATTTTTTTTTTPIDMEQRSVPMKVEPAKNATTPTTTTKVRESINNSSMTSSKPSGVTTTELQESTPMEIDTQNQTSKDRPVIASSSSSTSEAVDGQKKKNTTSTVAGTAATTTTTTTGPSDTTKGSTMSSTATTPTATSSSSIHPRANSQTTERNDDTVVDETRPVQGTATTTPSATASAADTAQDKNISTTRSDPPETTKAATTTTTTTGELESTESISISLNTTTRGTKKPDDEKITEKESPTKEQTTIKVPKSPSTSDIARTTPMEGNLSETKAIGIGANEGRDHPPDVEMKLEEEKSFETKSTVDAPTGTTKPMDTEPPDVKKEFTAAPPDTETTTESKPTGDEQMAVDVEMIEFTETPVKTKTIDQAATGSPKNATNDKEPNPVDATTTETEIVRTADRSTDGTDTSKSADNASSISTGPKDPKTGGAKSSSRPPKIEATESSMTQTAPTTISKTTKEAISASVVGPSFADESVAKLEPPIDHSAGSTLNSTSTGEAIVIAKAAHIVVPKSSSLSNSTAAAQILDSSPKSLDSTLQPKPKQPVPPLPTSTATTSRRMPKLPAKNFLLSDSDFLHYQAQEEHIRSFARLVTGKRTVVTGSKTKKGAAQLAKKRKLEQQSKSDLIDIPPLGTLTAEEERTYFTRMHEADLQVQLWMEHFRLARKTYWRGQRAKFNKISRPMRRSFGFFGAMEISNSDILSCQQCRATNCKLLQCLECHFIGCVPNIGENSSHMFEHMSLTGHHLGVALEPAADLYCFDCDNFIRHEIFDQEMLRLDLNEKLPWLAWGDRPVARSFDAMRFINIPDVGIVWNGMIAAYPSTIQSYHLEGSQRCHRRWFSFAGELDYLPSRSMSDALQGFVKLQKSLDEAHRFKIAKPVGMYNLGDTCFQSAVFQCLLNCVPVQNYFMNVGHNHLACPLYPKEMPHHALTEKQKQAAQVCLACELDKMFVNYYSSSIGFRVNEALSVMKSEKSGMALKQTQGEAIIASDMLAATWKCTDLSHLAGYGQNDAHEFLHGFLDVLQKHIKRYRNSVAAAAVQKGVKRKSGQLVDDTKTKTESPDIIKSLFEGKLRSVLLCTECGEKRKQSESFLSISLPLSKEVHRATEGRPGESTDGQGRMAKSKLSIERQLRHFTLPESLSDINCPACKKKTSTIKQHVVSKLPKILCLHLKRFDDKKKINDFVSFPLERLNMGSLLPQFCEVTNFSNSPEDSLNRNGNEDATVLAEAELLYDLFGTVNHFGTLQSGHYVANVKVKDKWFHCNDAHVSEISESDVLKSDAYLLFYSRR